MTKKSTMTRKDFLKAAALGAGVAGLSACGMPQTDASGGQASDFASKSSNMNGDNSCNTKGRMDLDLIRGIASLPGEYIDPRVCNITNKKARVEWNKAANKVRIRVRMDNVPYRPTVTRPPGTNAQTQFSPPFPETVTDAVYQIWLVTMSPVRSRKFYYDSTTFDCLGSDAYLANNNMTPPSDALIIHYPVLVLVCSPMIEPIDVQNGFGKLRLDWRFDYDKVIDAAGNGGQESTFGPLNLKTHAGQYRTLNSEIVPASQALSFDDFLRGNQFALDSTFEPNPKPVSLTSRFNPMIISGQVSAFPLPEGVYFDLRDEQVKPYPANCGGFSGEFFEGKNTCS